MIFSGGTNLLIAVVGGTLIAAYFLFIIWTAFDALRNEKLWWFVFIAGMPMVGAIVYFFVEKEHDYMKIKEK